MKKRWHAHNMGSMFSACIVVLSCIVLLSPMGAYPGEKVPRSDEDYLSVPLARAVNPAFAGDYAKKWVRCKVRYLGQSQAVMDLPREYREYVRIMVTDMDRTATLMDVVISKEKSDLIFELKGGESLEMFAYLVPITKRNMISGRSQRGVLFRVEKIVRIDEPKQ